MIEDYVGVSLWLLCLYLLSCFSSAGRAGYSCVTAGYDIEWLNKTLFAGQHSSMAEMVQYFQYR